MDNASNSGHFEITDEELRELERDLELEPEENNQNNYNNTTVDTEYWSKDTDETHLDELVELSDDGADIVDKKAEIESNHNDRPVTRIKRRDREEGELSDGTDNKNNNNNSANDNDDDYGVDDNGDEEEDGGDSDSGRRKKRREKFTSERSSDSDNPKSANVTPPFAPNSQLGHRGAPPVVPLRLPVHTPLRPPMRPPLYPQMNPQMNPHMRGPLPFGPSLGRMTPPHMRGFPFGVPPPPNAMMFRMGLRGPNFPWNPPLHPQFHHPQHFIPPHSPPHSSPSMHGRPRDYSELDFGEELDDYLRERDRRAKRSRSSSPPHKDLGSRHPPPPPVPSASLRPPHPHLPLPTPVMSHPPRQIPPPSRPLPSSRPIPSPSFSSPSHKPSTIILTSPSDQIPKRTLFVENLSQSTTLATIATHFSPLGTIESMKMTGPTSASVTYANPASALSAKRKFHRELLEGSRITVQILQ